MGPTRAVVTRAARRVALSSVGEVTGRTVNVALPFVVLALHSVDSATDVLFLALAVAYFVHGTLANVAASVHVTELARDSMPRSLRSILPWVVLTALISGAVSLWVAGEPLDTRAAWVFSISVATASAAGLIAAPAVAVLHSDHRYMMPGCTWIFRIVPLIAYLRWSSSSADLYLLLAGIAVSDTCRAVVLLVLSRHRLTIGGSAPRLRFPIEGIYLLAATLVSGLTPLAARWIASLGHPGMVSIYEMADRVYAAVASLATIGLGNVVLVYFSRLGKTPEGRQVWYWATRSAVVWSFIWVGVAGLIWYAFPFLGIVLPQQSDDTIEQMARTFITLSAGLPAFVMGMVCSRRILALGEARRLLPMAVWGLAISVAAGWLLLPLIGTTGVALGVVAGQYFVLLLMLTMLRGLERIANPRPF